MSIANIRKEDVDIMLRTLRKITYILEEMKYNGEKEYEYYWG